MRRHALALLLLLALLAPARAEVLVPVAARVANEAPGYCLWACVETLARAQGRTELYGLKDSRKRDPDVWEFGLYGGTPWLRYRTRNVGTSTAVREKMEAMGVTGYRLQPAGSTELALIKEALAAGHGAAVAVRWTQGNHAVVLTHLDDRHVKYIDPNEPDRVIARERCWFAEAWLGMAFSLD